MHQNLVVVNLSQQSDSSDLLGGFKPVDGKIMAIPLKEEFERLFECTFSMKRNAKFLEGTRKAFVKKQWRRLITLFTEACKMAKQRLVNRAEKEVEDTDHQSVKPKKARTGEKAIDNAALVQQWEAFGESVLQFEARQSQENKLVFSFIEGSLVKAVRKGYWILLDEINLATTETLECLSGLIQDAEGSILLTEKGDTEPIRRHPNFRVFACMNPATDVGKKDLPPGLRNRFTEFFVHPPDARKDDLLTIVKKYLATTSHGDERACMDVTEFYMEAKNLQAHHKLADGANQRPHYSMRTLSRALSYVAQIAPNYGLRRALYEGFSMTFSTLLNKESTVLMSQLIEKHLLKGVKNPRALITQIPRPPTEEGFVQFGHFWLSQGPEVLDEVEHYILTSSVEKNLYNLARVVMSNKYPVLLQGPTSAGKTSMIEYLAKRTGHKFIRINNHEHTDLQEYLGTYVSQDGQLTFQEGALVEALRKGYWIVLDELNLAPSDVLEALNRLLDDNRELLIPETQEVVKPHPHFMLFATQNPAGLYGGRKALSRAFRNRFLELHFDDIPEDELETILAKRCQIAPSYCKKLVQVYKQLMEHRQRTRIFDGKHGFITLRDMFRWAGREALGYQELAEHGYMILAERTRREEEKAVVKKVIETVMRAKIDEANLYDCSHLPEFKEFERRVVGSDQSSVAWTKAMKRLFTLVAQCIRFNEPVLLVGDTGCGKTTVCQMLAIAREQQLHIVNCHQNTETSDLLGGQRPLRNKSGIYAELREHLDPFLRAHFSAEEAEQLISDYDIDDVMAYFEAHVKSDCSIEHGEENIAKEIQFIRSLYKKSIGLFEWHDGPLVQSMKEGDLFLLDEISLADDSVLERLNSVLEPHRLLVLAEKGGAHVEELFGHHRFQFLATMNPGGDYGKKELSPALRNRFTEIWVPSVTDEDDLKQIIQERLKAEDVKPFASKMLDFINWYVKALGKSRSIISLRDVLSWVEFMNEASSKLGPEGAFIHGGSLVLLDGIGSNGSPGTVFTGEALKNFKIECLARLSGRDSSTVSTSDLYGISSEIESTPSHFGVAPFFISKESQTNHKVKFALRAPTTFANLVRVLRALQIKKPILLEGSPGVGKTSLISALASASGRNLVRINLSEQTDLMDLFGSDLPVEGGKSGEFAWRDAPFLQAMQSGEWVLLDEINLASQSVLEGLNSCLDHRGSVYIPELDRSFGCAKEFRIFAAQNPIQQGGGRKGLPKSFLNRFTQVYVDQLVKDDLMFICQHSFPAMDITELEKVIEFNNRMHEETMVRRSFGMKGSPWEFNLRDVFRWLDLLNSDHGLRCTTSPSEYLDMIYLKRMRTPQDRECTVQLYNQVFKTTYQRPDHPFYQINPSYLQVGHSVLPRRNNTTEKLTGEQLHLLHTMLGPMESVMKCVEMNWMAIVTGSSGSGKTSLVRILAQLTGNVLQEFSMNSGVDTMELLGGFEQVELSRYRQKILDGLRQATCRLSKLLLTLQIENQSKVVSYLQQLSNNLFALEQQHFSLDTSKSQSEAEFDCSLVEHQISLISRIIEEFDFSTISSDLVPTESDLSDISQMIGTLKVMQKETVSGKFEWIDGVLIEALEKGHWILIDNANLCNPSILDRLNPLFETNGVLMVNERGLVNGEVKIIQPHKNFRLFMTVDPQNGELSRAMRNRGVEIVLLPQGWSSDDQDIIRLANNMGIPGSKLPLLLKDIHTSADTYRATFNTRNYTLLLHMVVELLQRGSNMVSAVKEALSYVNFVSTDDDEHKSNAILTELAEICKNGVESLGDNFFSPANFPYLINGDFLRKESTLATIILQSAYLIYLLQEKQSAIDTQNDEKLSKIDSCIRYASVYFIESTCTADINLRMQLLDFVATHETLSTVADSMNIEKYLLKEITQHSLASYMEKQKSALTTALNLDPVLMGNQPLNLKMNPFLFTALNTLIASQSNESVSGLWANYKNSVDAFELLIRVKRIEYEENALFAKAERIKISNLNLVQQSFCHSIGRLSESQLTNPIVAQLYPTTATLRSWILEKLEAFQDGTQQTFTSIAHELLDKRDIFWQVIQKNFLDFGELSTAVQWLLKITTKAFQTDPTLKPLGEIVFGMSSHIGLHSSKTMKILWKALHPSTLSSMELYTIEEKYHKVQEDWDLYESDNKGGFTLKYDHPLIFTDAVLKRTFIEGLASLYFSTEDAKTEVIIESANSMLEHIQDKFQNYNEIAEKATDQVGLIASTKLELAPLMDFTSILWEMEILAELCKVLTLSGADMTTMQLIDRISKFFTFSLSATTRAPNDFVGYQKLLWHLSNHSEEEEEKIISHVRCVAQDLIFSWHLRLWRTSYNKPGFEVSEDLDVSKDNDSYGPARLFQDVYTTTCFSFLDALKSAPLNAYRDKVESVQKLKSHLTTQDLTHSNRSTLDASILMSTIKQLLYSFRTTFQTETYEKLIGTLSKVEKIIVKLVSRTCSSSDEKDAILTEVKQSLTALSVEVHNGSNITLTNVFDKYISRAFTELIEGYLSDISFETMVKQGKAWIWISLGFVAAYIPEHPVDPAVKAKMKWDTLQERQCELKNEVQVRQGIEVMMTGQEDNIMISEKQESLNAVSGQIRDYTGQVVLRPEDSQYSNLFNELQYMRNNIINEDSLLELVSELETKRDENLVSRELLFQDTTMQFLQRMMYKYPLYKDVLQPVFVAVSQLKYGVRLVSTHSQYLLNEEGNFLTKLIDALLYPSNGELTENVNESIEYLANPDTIRALKQLIDESKLITQKLSVLMQYIIAVLHKVFIASKTSGYLCFRYLEIADYLFDRLMGIWQLAEEARKKRQIEEQSLYKHKEEVHTALTDEEIEAQELRELFPDFRNDFLDLERNENDDPQENSKPKKTILSEVETTTISEEDIAQVAYLHESLVSKYSVAHCKKFEVDNAEKDFEKMFVHSYNVATHLAKLAGGHLPYELDRKCRSAHVYVTALWSKEYATDSLESNNDDTYDFYKDSNVLQTSRLVPILEKFIDRVQFLVDTWPEHAVLAQILEVARRISGFPATSPIMKFLTGLELLLQKSEDWQAYTSKEFSLKVNLDEVINLIVSWRHLELKCWSKLIQAQDRYIQESALSWWFHLYNSVVKPSWELASREIESSEMNMDDGEMNTDLKEHLNNLLATLDQFLQSSSYGEFKTRHQLLVSFSHHLEQKYFLSEQATTVWTAVLNAVWNVCQYYGQFLQPVDEAIKKLRKPIEKELIEYVKIASWKDINVYALKQSSAKTHKHLNKFIKKYKEVLRNPITQIIQAYMSDISFNVVKESSKKASKKNKKRKTISAPTQTVKDVLWKDQESLKMIPEEISGTIQQFEHQLLEVDLSVEKNVQLLARFQKFCRDDITKLYIHTDGQVLDSFSGDIISQIKEFQDMVLPATKESEKMLKNQKSIRRKALVDFLKQLRRVGLKYRIRAQAMKQSDFKYVCQLGKIDLGELFNLTPTRLISSKVNQWANDTILPLWSKSNEYYYKILARMSFLRDIATHSPKDLTFQEVEKGMGFTEHLLSFVMKEREVMHKLDHSYKSLAAIYRQWKDLSPSTKKPASESVTLNSRVSQGLESHKYLMDRLSESVYGAILLVDAHCRIHTSSSAYSSAKQDLEIVLKSILNLQSSTGAAFEMFLMYPKYAVKMDPIITSHVYDILDTNVTELKTIKQNLNEYILRYPELEYLITSIISSIPAHMEPIRHQVEKVGIEEEHTREVLNNVSKLIQSLLVIIQELRKLQKSRESELSVDQDYDEFGLRENHISDAHNIFLQTSKMLHMPGVIQACQQISASTTTLMEYHHDGSPLEPLVTHVLSICVPFLEQYLSISCLHLHEFLVHHKALNKLCMVVCNTFLTLFTKGYCIPEVQSEEQEMDDGDAQGTGVGEGDTSGAQDVSNEIEDEDQVLGTEDQKPQEPDTNDTSKEEENGLDMENDFEGKMEDVIESDKEQNDDESEEEEEEEPEDQMGDFDDLDPNAVDEKIWGDDGDDEQEDEENARDLDDTNQDVGEEESEMVAKDDENEEDQQDNSDKKEKSAQESGQDQPEEKDDRPDEEDQSGSEDAEDEQEDRVNAEPTEMPEAGDLELAEDLNLSEVSSDEESDEEEKEGEDGMDDDGDMMDVDEPKSKNPEESEDEENAVPADEAKQDESDDVEENEEENDEQADNDASAQGVNEDENPDENEEDGEIDPENRIGAEEEEEEVEGQEGENPEEEPIDAPDQETDKPQSGSQSNAGMNSAGAVGLAGNADDNQDAADEPNQGAEDSQAAQNESSMPTDGQTVQNTQNEDAENTSEKENEPNPHRSLSEALEKWKKLKTVARSEEEQEKPENSEEQVNEKSQFEFVQDDEDHEADTLGVANEEQMQNTQNQDLAAMDEDEETEDPEQVADMNIDEETPEEEDTQQPELANGKMNPEGGSLFSKNMERLLEDDLDELSIQEGAGKGNMEIDSNIEEVEPLTQEQIEAMREELERNLTKWREDGESMNNARELWHQYELLTHDLALGLCEQLRLILEPTLATKMKGDYRTGKRLNMKKIIPYIASQFKKDKIWLRRTKPSKRQYQVMIAVDDSKSMSESHSIQLAYETIALVSKSLSLLEVGELSIVSFGQDVKLVHPFDQPFASEAGAQVIQNFTFRQNKTNVTQLMESSIGLFTERKYSQSSNAELWQLQLIISDGVCEDHGKLQALVRNAAEQRIMVVFIILDNKPEKDSIMAVNSIQYKTINGKLSMSMVRYLDTFPFEYYVILRDINSLPEVLSDALRQYFSLVNGC
ncbi:AAA ATPase midasin [Basidiobolus ranarum]|uniref:Midasin n=1 Tax=Basidiobolus ranarum TaxID=34480 RepID=A0ABR2X231_9FUNG